MKGKINTKEKAMVALRAHFGSNGKCGQVLGVEGETFRRWGASCPESVRRYLILAANHPEATAEIARS